MGLLDAVREGWALALGFNPLTAIAGSAIAAMLLSRRSSPALVLLAALALVAAWLLGDGIAVLAHASEAWGSEGAGAAERWVTIAIWALGGLAIGALVPAWAGAFVGRRVTFGTGWASAAVVAATLSTALSTIAARIG